MGKLLTKNMLEVLRFIESFRFLPLSVLVEICIENGIYAKRESVSRVIKRLEERNFIGSYLWGNNSKALFIKGAGIRELANAFNWPISFFTSPSFKDRIQTYGLEHTIEIANIYKNLNTFLNANSNLRIEFWKGDQNVKCFYEFNSVLLGKKVKRVLEPDSYFRISDSDKQFEFFLEFDTGSMYKKQLVNKFTKYFEYFVYGNWKDRYIHFPYILFITERSEKLMEKMLVPFEEDLQSLLYSREKLNKTSNLIYEAVGNSENLQTFTDNEISDFITNKFIFTYYKKEWQKEVLNLLS